MRYRHARVSGQGRLHPREAQGLAGGRRGRSCHRDRVLVGDHRAHRQRRAALDRRSVHRARHRRPECSTPTGRSTRISLAASCISRSRTSRRRPGFIARCSSASAPWTPWASTTWSCFRPRCCRSACIRRSMPRSRSARRFNRWMVEQVLPQDKRQMALLYLPFNDPDAWVEVVEEFADKPGVVGFSIASTRHKPVWHNSYMRLYGALQDCGKPLGFHAGFSWSDPSFQQLNRFIGMHRSRSCTSTWCISPTGCSTGCPSASPSSS